MTEVRFAPVALAVRALSKIETRLFPVSATIRTLKSSSKKTPLGAESWKVEHPEVEPLKAVCPKTTSAPDPFVLEAEVLYKRTRFHPMSAAKRLVPSEKRYPGVFETVSFWIRLQDPFPRRELGAG